MYCKYVKFACTVAGVPADAPCVSKDNVIKLFGDEMVDILYIVE
jgi:hypothetical protein